MTRKCFLLSMSWLSIFLFSVASLAQQPTTPSPFREREEFAEQKANRRTGRRVTEALTPVDALSELLEHQKMLAQLLRRTYNGGRVEFECAEGRLVCRLIDEIGDLARELGKNISK